MLYEQNMNIIGIDFTSRPSASKPITCLQCEFVNSILTEKKLEEWCSFTEFESFLCTPEKWIAGIDFPFGMSRRFIQNIGWPLNWKTYVSLISSMRRKEFRTALDRYKAPRPYGDKEHKRKTDKAAKSLSPQKQYVSPVGLMFFEGAPRLLKSGVNLPGILPGDPNRVVVEAYPGILAKRLIGKSRYKHDNPKEQSEDQKKVRRDILIKILDGSCFDDYGFSIEASMDLCNDPTGDHLDSLLCAMQAAWAWEKRKQNFGVPQNTDSLEGWIADPISCAEMSKDSASSEN